MKTKAHTTVRIESDPLDALPPEQLRALARAALDLVTPSARQALLGRYLGAVSDPLDPFPEAFAAIERAVVYLDDHETDLAGWQNGAYECDRVGDEVEVLVGEIDLAFAAVNRRLGSSRPSAEDRRQAEELLQELRDRFLGWENPYATGVTLGEQLFEGVEQADLLSDLLADPLDQLPPPAPGADGGSR